MVDADIVNGITLMFDDEAEEILKEYQDIVISIARSAYYSSSAIDFFDLCQIGNLAVLTAVRSYDPAAGSNIRSYVSRIVKREIYNEAGRFLGVFTVDHRLTRLAALTNTLRQQGCSDEEIAHRLSEKSGRNITTEHVVDLYTTYVHRFLSEVPEEIEYEPYYAEDSISSILESVVNNDVDRLILGRRIMGDSTASDVAKELQITRKKVYELERVLRERIKHAIEEAT